jgi:hypothetical protein
MEKFLVKEHELGFRMLTGTLQGKVFKSANSKIKFNIDFLTKDERLFDNILTARIHTNMLNNIIG